MKRALLILLFVLAACSQQVVCNAPYIQIGTECCLDSDANAICDRDEPKAVSFEEVADEQVSEEQLAPEPEAMLPVDVIIAKMRSRLQSYRFTGPYGKYGESKFDGSTWYVKGDMIRVDLHDSMSVEEGKNVDVIVFNTANRTATGYCRQHEALCRGIMNEEFKLDYSQHYVATPVDRLMDYKGDKEEVVRFESEVVEDRLATLIVFKNADKLTSIWVDAHYGVPLRIKEEQGKTVKLFIYDEMAFNTVKDAFFTDFNLKDTRR